MEMLLKLKERDQYIDEREAELASQERENDKHNNFESCRRRWGQQSWL